MGGWGAAHTGWLLFGLAPGPCHAAQRSSPGPQGSSLSMGRPQGWGEPAPSRKGPGLLLMGRTAHQGLLCCPCAHIDYLGEGLLPSHCRTPAPLCIPLVTRVTATHPSSGCISHRQSHVSPLFCMPPSCCQHCPQAGVCRAQPCGCLPHSRRVRPHWAPRYAGHHADTQAGTRHWHCTGRQQLKLEPSLR